jgi:signal transduction histidine kinase
MTDSVAAALMSVLEDVALGVAIFEHGERDGGARRVAANRAWLVLGDATLDAIVVASGFVEEPRLIESQIEHEGRVTPLELRLDGSRAGGAPRTVAVAAPVQPPALKRVAHDLSNPLTYLLIHLRRLRDTVPGLVPEAERPRIEQLLVEALEGGERVVAILRDLVVRVR